MSEKELILRGWQGLDEDAVVREVATKGKYIDLCLSYLGTKKTLTELEARIYFEQKVDVYCNRLIKNRQLFKAEHVMKNLKLDPKLIFFQKSQEVDEFREFILEHLAKQTANWNEGLEGRLQENWAIFRCLKREVQLEDIDMNSLTFSKFYNLEECTKQRIAIKCYFQSEDVELVDLLEKEPFWRHLLVEKFHDKILQWIQTQAAMKKTTHKRLMINAKEMEKRLTELGDWPQEHIVETTVTLENTSEFRSAFKQSLVGLFQKWSIDAAMMEQIQQFDVCKNEAILNGLAGLGYFIEAEKEDIEAVVKRLIASKSDVSVVRENPSFNKCLIRYLLRQRMSVELCNDYLVDHDLLREVEEEEHRAIKDLILGLKKLFGVNVCLSDAIEVSKLISRTILVEDDGFYTHNPAVKLFEDIHDISFENYNERYREFFAEFARLNAFVDLLSHPTPPPPPQLVDLVRSSTGIDVIAMKHRLTNGNNSDLYFGNPVLAEKYGFKFRLGYVHFVRQCRGAYAVYVFAVEQLRLHGKITKHQTMVAAKKVSDIAIANHVNRELCCHCVAFIEILGVETTRLRATLRCLAMVGDRQPFAFTSAKQLAAVLESGAETASVVDLEAARTFAETFDLPLPQVYLKNLCRHNDWVAFLLLAEYLQYPRKQVMVMCRDHFGDTCLGMNLWRALKYDSVAVEGGRRKLSVSLKRRMSFKTETLLENAGPASSDSIHPSKRQIKPEIFLTEDYDTDLFAVLLQSTPDTSEKTMDWEGFKNQLVSREALDTTLIKRCIKLRWPLLSILAADENPALLHYSWLAWLLTSTAVNTDDPLVPTSRCESFIDCGKYAIESAVQSGCTAALLLGFQIFFPDSPFVHLADYLDRTHRHDFSADVTFLLKNYLHTLNSREMVPDLFQSRTACINFSIQLLVSHLGSNFQSLYHQQLFLHSLNDSDISYFNTIVDFGMLRQVFDIIELTEVEVNNFQFFCRDVYADEQIRDEYVNIRDRLVAGKHYDKALALSTLLKLEKETVIYESWVSGYETDPDGFDADTCEAETLKYGIKPMLMLKFFLFVAKRPGLGDVARYRILKKTLDTIKRFGLHYELDRDAIEYELLLTYVRFEAGTDSESGPVELEIYHSEHYETVVLKERGVLHNPFVELKETAGIDDLTVTDKKLEDPVEISRLEALICALLDKGDIIQALRCQAIFDHRPLDLHFIVFCMALAEDLVTLYDLPRAERQLLNENLNTVAVRFNKRTLRPNRISQTSMSSSPSRQNPLEAADTSGGLLEFEEIPSREKQDVLEAIEGLASQIQHGIKLVRRIVMVYRAAMYLDKAYTDILKIKKPEQLLRMAVADDCLNKLVVLHDIVTSMEMTADEIADYISQQIAASIIQSRFYIVQGVAQPSTNPATDQRDELWGFDLHDQFHLILELCPDTTLLGHYLLEYCEAIKLYRDLEREKIADAEAGLTVATVLLNKRNDRERNVFENLLALLNGQVLSHKKQNTINVELLIKAHDCFVHECSMEGIVTVLQKCRSLTSTLTNAKSWNLVVKLLVGVGRFGEMYYCFDTLIRNDQFESLLGQFNEKHTKSLKTAIISYLNEHQPGNAEYFRLAALHFLMYRELAEMWEAEARQIVVKVVTDYETTMVMEKKFELAKKGEAHRHPKITVPYLRCTPALLVELTTAMDDWVHATENHLLDNQLAQAQKLVSHAELVALQINLANKCLESTSSLDGEALCVNVLSVRTCELLQYLVNYELSVAQSLILERANAFNVNWTEAIYIRFVLMGGETFFKDYLERMDLSEAMIENIVKNFQLESKISKTMETAMVKILEHIPTVTLRYRLASLLGMKRIIFDLINSDSVFYMKDTDYGRKNEEL